MLILAVDTSSILGSIAVARTENQLGVVSARSPEGFSSRLFRQVELLTGKLGISLKEIDLYAVNAGPGSFTGLRVGLTAVKAWAEVYQKPIAAVSGLEAVAAQSKAMSGEMSGNGDDGPNGGADEERGEGGGRIVVPVIDARRGQIYGGVYQRTRHGLEARGEGCVMTATEFLRELGKRFERCEATFITPGPELLRGPLMESEFSGSPMEIASPALAPWIAQLGLGKAGRGECVDALQLEANYIRRADAELNAETGAEITGGGRT
jgi:tRNA threonylcarbamoyladenosine biosynthesis protein TsaB